MELVSSDLKTVMNNSKKLEIEEDHCLVMMYNMLCAINFMHSSNIVHRDIKPSNILMFDDCSMMLCDFGLARSLPDTDLMDICQEINRESDSNRST